MSEKFVAMIDEYNKELLRDIFIQYSGELITGLEELQNHFSIFIILSEKIN